MIVAGERRQFRGGRMHGGPPPEVGHKILRAEFRQFAKAGDRAAGVALEAEMAGSETRPAREESVDAKGQRTEERRAGKECGSTGRIRGSTYPKKKKKKN